MFFTVMEVEPVLWGFDPINPRYNVTGLDSGNQKVRLTNRAPLTMQVSGDTGSFPIRVPFMPGMQLPMNYVYSGTWEYAR